MALSVVKEMDIDRNFSVRPTDIRAGQSFVTAVLERTADELRDRQRKLKIFVEEAVMISAALDDVMKLLDKHGRREGPTEQPRTPERQRAARAGLTKLLLLQRLKEHHPERMSTGELAKELDMPAGRVSAALGTLKREQQVDCKGTRPYTNWGLISEGDDHDGRSDDES